MQKPLEMNLEVDHHHLERGRESVLHLIASVTAHATSKAPRSPLSVIFVLDVSISMRGEPLAKVADAARKLVHLLEPTDRIGIVTFAETAALLLPVAPNDRAHKKAIDRALHQMRTGPATNIHAGLSLALAKMPPARPGERQAILLLSDGMPNVGITSPNGLGEVAQSIRKRASISTLGFGSQHDETVLAAVAECGAGRYHYIRDPALCQLQLASALGAQQDIIADDIELHLDPKPGLKILHTLGQDGPTPTVKLPGLTKGGTHLVAVRMSAKVPKDQLTSTPFPLAEVHLRYRAYGDRAALNELATVSCAFRASKMAIPALHKVLVLRAEEERKRARALYASDQRAKAAASLRSAADMIASAPGFCSDDGSKLADAWDQLSDDADFFEQRPDQEAYREFLRGQPLFTGGNLDQDTHAGHALVNDAAGDLPTAAFVDESSGVRYQLARPINVIGRSRNCDIVVPSSKVSRQSARVVAAGGRFWIEDLGSANGVYKGSRKVDRAPLEHGDVVTVGDACLRYELR